MSRVFAYARVSTVVQLTENQREQVAQAGYDIPPRRFVEEKVSGSVHASQRPGFQKLIERMEPGDTLVVTKLDRIGRDSIDVQQTVTAFENLGMRLIVLQLGNLDLTSSAGSLMVKVLAAVADFERDLIIERTHAGQARARAEGKHMGRPSKTTEDDRKAIRSAPDGSHGDQHGGSLQGESRNDHRHSGYSRLMRPRESWRYRGLSRDCRNFAIEDAR